jgi:hypothetical protein
VWETPACTTLFNLLGETDFDDSNNATASSSSRSRSLIDIEKLTDAKRSVATFNAHWGDAEVHAMCVLMALRDEEIAELKNVWYVFNFQAPFANQAEVFEQVPLSAAMEPAFKPRRYGWLGGDVAASVPLPNEQNHQLPPTKLLWLYGDSIIGVSDSERYVRVYALDDADVRVLLCVSCAFLAKALFVSRTVLFVAPSFLHKYTGA